MSGNKRKLNKYYPEFDGCSLNNFTRINLSVIKFSLN